MIFWKKKLPPITRAGTLLQDTRMDDDTLIPEETTTKESTESSPAPPPGLEHVQPELADYWKREGNKWVRYHKIPRRKLFNPAETLDGPDVTRLLDERVTATRYDNGTTEVHTDNWKDVERQNYETPVEWIGTTTFTERDMYHGELRDSVTDQGRLSKCMGCPEKST